MTTTQVDLWFLMYLMCIFTFLDPDVLLQALPFYPPTMIALMAIIAFQKSYRLSQSEFIIPFSKFIKSFSQPFSAGSRFKVRYESDDASERRLVCYSSHLLHRFMMVDT
jgi:hypothetical protein